jgi:hypothetical protein
VIQTYHTQKLKGQIKTYLINQTKEGSKGSLGMNSTNTNMFRKVDLAWTQGMIIYISLIVVVIMIFFF